jgi:hypothetical protein
LAIQIIVEFLTFKFLMSMWLDYALGAAGTGENVENHMRENVK